MSRWVALRLAFDLACFALSALAESAARWLGLQPSGRSKVAASGRVAVIGGGIAGCGACWALQKSQFEVEVFEAAETLGGNAKTFLWPDGRRTGLSVLAWPSEYFHNYTALLSQLGVEHETVDLGFHVRDPEGRDFRHGDESSSLMQHHKTGIARWERMVRVARAVNHVFNGFPSRKSLYDLNLLNPLNVMPLRWLSILFGVSRECWDNVIVPVYASTFLTIELDMVPSIILPIMSDIVPLSRPASLRSWKVDSSVVFSKMFQESSARVHLNTPIKQTSQDRVTQKWTVETMSGTKYSGFDRIIFASSAKNVADSTGVLPPCFRNLFSHIRYTQETDRSMHEGRVHSDPGIFPPDLVDPKHTSASGYNILRDTANFISVHRRPDGSSAFTNTFVLSSWIPSLVHEGNTTPRLVTYDGLANSQCSADQANAKHPDASLASGTVVNDWNHPVLNPVSLACQYLLRFIQGRRGVYFCGSLATPGNGHDLSLCSGFAVAVAVGAKFPFEDSALCRSDLKKLSGLMGLAGEKEAAPVPP